MSVVEVVVRGQSYWVPQRLLNTALVTFDQQYKRFDGTVPELCRAIANDLIAHDSSDPFGPERLARCIMSLKGRRGGRKKSRVSLPHQDNQLTLF